MAMEGTACGSQQRFISLNAARFREHLQCSICLEIMRDCHQLTTCSHSFCHECILKLFRGSTIHQLSKALCPLCNKLFGMSEITKNFQLQNLIQIYSEASILPVQHSITGISNINSTEVLFENVSLETDTTIESDSFTLNFLDWRLRLLIEADKCSVILLVDEETNKKQTHWECTGQCTLQLVNCNKPRLTILKKISHKFKEIDNQACFRFMSRKQLLKPNNGFMFNRSLLVRCEIRVTSSYGISLKTRHLLDFVGLNHLNLTSCYVNPVIQMLFFLAKLRIRLLTRRSLLASNSPDRGNSPAQALQQVFAKLQTSPCSVLSRELHCLKLPNRHTLDMCRILLQSLDDHFRDDFISNMFDGSLLRSAKEEPDRDASLIEKFRGLELKATRPNLEDCINHFLMKNRPLLMLNVDVEFVKLPGILLIQLNYTGRHKPHGARRGKFTFPYFLDMRERARKLTSPFQCYFLYAMTIERTGKCAVCKRSSLIVNLNGDQNWLVCNNEHISPARQERFFAFTNGEGLLKDHRADMLVYVACNAKDQLIQGV